MTGYCSRNGPTFQVNSFVAGYQIQDNKLDLYFLFRRWGSNNRVQKIGRRMASSVSSVSGGGRSRRQGIRSRCGCGDLVGKWTGWRSTNPGRRFVGCPNFRVSNMFPFQLHQQNPLNPLMNKIPCSRRRVVATFFGLTPNCQTSGTKTPCLICTTMGRNWRSPLPSCLSGTSSCLSGTSSCLSGTCSGSKAWRRWS